MPTNPNFPTLNGTPGRAGRPTKRTPKIAAELLGAISAGAPFSLACQAAGVCYQTFQTWRREDPAFDMEVDQAAARATVDRLREIDRQGRDGSWTALAWLCERRHASLFGRPEVQLAHAVRQEITNNTLTINIDGETAKALQARAEKVSSQVEKLFATHTARSANSATPADNNNW